MIAIINIIIDDIRLDSIDNVGNNGYSISTLKCSIKNIISHKTTIILLLSMVLVVILCYTLSRYNSFHDHENNW